MAFNITSEGDQLIFTSKNLVLGVLFLLPYWYNVILGRQVRWIHALHKKYGTVVRVGPKQLSFIDGRAWKDIYGHRTGGRASNHKDEQFYSKPINGIDSLITEPSDAEHGRIRKIFANAFSHKALVEQEPLIRKYAELLVSQTSAAAAAAAATSPFDLVKLYNFTTFDIMGDLTFGEPLHLLRTNKYTPWVDAVFGGFKAGDLARITLEYPLLRAIWTLATPRRLAAMRRAHFQHSADRVERRLAAESPRPDIWSLALRDGGDGARLERGKMHSNAALFMLAGTETTATLLSGLTYHLLRAPDKLRVLLAEIRGAFAAVDEMDLVNLQRLPYLSACVEEGLRMYPPVPFALPRKIAPGGAETRVYVPQFAAYHSAVNFVSPDAFLPERWMGGPEFESDRRDVLQPFSFGPRNCLGKK
ncbi:putative cytochrome p450 protein [Neofusicoccum parvum UCRNP2]|uniref:Putative cytochrome p450 protein n=1 Tax=Botryosphaeria parva (strain UCR-NP2) TaxID=1287680 RepID=R1GX70_BOTPV|nr:putative cytochrome p450 protein [Neofusicoccum parvum UCRNP2]